MSKAIKATTPAFEDLARKHSSNTPTLGEIAAAVRADWREAADDEARIEMEERYDQAFGNPLCRPDYCAWRRGFYSDISTSISDTWPSTQELLSRGLRTSSD